MIVGAGPTGIEVSGAIGDMVHHTLPDEYPDLPLYEVGVHLVDTARRRAEARFSEKATSLRGQDAAKSAGSRFTCTPR